MSDTYAKKEAAERYDSARALPDETVALWMDKLRKAVPAERVVRILDLGGGTGRFATPMQKAYDCPVIVVDPSEAMLKQGRKLKAEDISWIRGAAEHIPLADNSVDLVWMCNVYHHLEDRPAAFDEINRILVSSGYLVVRNGTQESDSYIDWMSCFPEAVQIGKKRIPTRAALEESICQHGFRTEGIETIHQLFARSYVEYYEKISKRGLFPLLLISDEAFNAGLARL